MGIVSFLSKGRKVTFRAKSTPKSKVTPKRKSKTGFTSSQISRIGQAEQAIKNAKSAGIPFTKKQERKLRQTAVSDKSSRSTKTRSRVIDNNSDLNCS